MAESPIGTCVVTLRAHTHVRALCIQALSFREAELTLQTFVNVCYTTRKKKQPTLISTARAQ